LFTVKSCLRTSCVVSVTTVVTRHIQTVLDFWADFKQWQTAQWASGKNNCGPVLRLKDNIKTLVVTFDTAKHLTVSIEHWMNNEEMIFCLEPVRFGKLHDPSYCIPFVILKSKCYSHLRKCKQVLSYLHLCKCKYPVCNLTQRCGSSDLF